MGTEITPIENICECFKSIVIKNLVSFYTYSDDSDILCMPHVPKTNFRYNNCPCCGTEIRDIKLSKYQISSL